MFAAAEGLYLHCHKMFFFLICGQMANSHHFLIFVNVTVIRCTEELKTSNVYRVLAPATAFNRRVDLFDVLSFTWSKSITF